MKAAAFMKLISKKSKKNQEELCEGTRKILTSLAVIE